MLPSQRLPYSPIVDRPPLRLPDGEGASLPLGPFGEFGFYNSRGRLVLTVPRPAASCSRFRTARFSWPLPPACPSCPWACR